MKYDRQVKQLGLFVFKLSFVLIIAGLFLLLLQLFKLLLLFS